METIDRQLEPVGPGERAAFGEGAGEVGRVGKRARHDRVACDEIGGRPERRSAIREYELQGVVACYGYADEFNHRGLHRRSSPV